MPEIITPDPMTPTQISALEAEYLTKARVAKADQDHSAAAAWQGAAAMLVVAAHAKQRRRFCPSPLYTRRVAG